MNEIETMMMDAFRDFSEKTDQKLVFNHDKKLIAKYSTRDSQSNNGVILYAMDWILIDTPIEVDSGTIITVEPQYRVGPYTLDFILSVYFDVGSSLEVGIEIDGHDYHERTKQQAQHDKSRDRYLLATGLPVIRFTGSEVYTNAIHCAREVNNLLVTLAYLDICRNKDQILADRVVYDEVVQQIKGR